MSRGINHEKERVFLISTTHGAETHCLAAAIAAIKAIKKEKSIIRNISIGKRIKNNINKLLDQFDLHNYISIKGHPAWQLMQFRDNDKKLCDGYKTLVFQETTKHGILFRGTFVPTISHTEKDIEKTIYAFYKTFEAYKKALLDEKGYRKYLIGDSVKPVFRKWN